MHTYLYSSFHFNPFLSAKYYVDMRQNQSVFKVLSLLCYPTKNTLQHRTHRAHHIRHYTWTAQLCAHRKHSGSRARVLSTRSAHFWQCARARAFGGVCPAKLPTMRYVPTLCSNRHPMHLRASSYCICNVMVGRG